MQYKKILPIIGLIILIYVLSKLDFGKLVEVFQQVDPFYGFLAIFSILPLQLVSNFQWQLILKKHNINVSYLYSLKNIYIGYFYGFITPGAIGGYTRVYYLKDESGETIQKCFVNSLIISTIEYLTLLSIALFGAFLFSSRYPSILPFLIFMFVLIVILLFIFIRKKTGKRFIKKLLFSRLFNQYRDKWEIHIDNLYKDIPRIRDLFIPSLISIGGWLAWFTELYLIASLFSIDIPFYNFIFLIPIVTVVSLLPISIQGLGTREAMLIGLFSLFNIPQENVLGFSLLWYVAGWLVPSIIGTIVTLHEMKRKPKVLREL